VNTINVRYIGRQEVREVTLEEARKILESIYEDAMGGMVADAVTGVVISQINEDVKEILVIDQMLGGG
jgi:glucosamine 6-phosphate synthetase-like amidotransferase/phosphosugar isomerase protein